MRDKIISQAYAKSMIELADDTGVDIADELTRLNIIINENNNLETLLFLDVFTANEKQEVLNLIVEKMGLSSILKYFFDFLLQEKRMGLFPMIYKEIIVIDDDKRGFIRGVIEGAHETISSEFSEKITEYLQSKIKKRTELKYKRNEKITAGYKVTVGDLQLDATLDNQLKILKEKILD